MAGFDDVLGALQSAAQGAKQTIDEALDDVICGGLLYPVHTWAKSIDDDFGYLIDRATDAMLIAGIFVVEPFTFLWDSLVHCSIVDGFTERVCGRHHVVLAMGTACVALGVALTFVGAVPLGLYFSAIGALFLGMSFVLRAMCEQRVPTSREASDAVAQFGKAYSAFQALKNGDDAGVDSLVEVFEALSVRYEEDPENFIRDANDISSEILDELGIGGPSTSVKVQPPQSGFVLAPFAPVKAVINPGFNPGGGQPSGGGLSTLAIIGVLLSVLK